MSSTMSITANRFDLSQLDAISTRAVNGSVCFWSEDSLCCYKPQDPAEAADLASQRERDFLADESPFFTRGTTVSASRKKMSRGIKDFDSTFNRATDKA